MALSEAINTTDPTSVQLAQRRLLVASDNDGIVARIGSFGVGSWPCAKGGGVVSKKLSRPTERRTMRYKARERDYSALVGPLSRSRN